MRHGLHNLQKLPLQVISFWEAKHAYTAKLRYVICIQVLLGTILPNWCKKLFLFSFHLAESTTKHLAFYSVKTHHPVCTQACSPVRIRSQLLRSSLKETDPYQFIILSLMTYLHYKTRFSLDLSPSRNERSRPFRSLPFRER